MLHVRLLRPSGRLQLARFSGANADRKMARLSNC